VFNATHPQYPSPQERWRSKAVETKEVATKMQNKTPDVLAPAGISNHPASEARQYDSMMVSPLPAPGLSAPH
jgi:hypothetical protein